jgi:enoyl-CoA hydratase
MALTGDPILAERAFDLGMISRLCEPGQSLPVALELAATIGANGPLATQAIKCILRESLDWPDSEFFTRQSAISEPVMASEDAREGARAFAEKRAPIWRRK